MKAHPVLFDGEGEGSQEGGTIIPVYNSHTHSKRSTIIPVYNSHTHIQNVQTNCEGSHSVRLFERGRKVVESCSLLQY